jgi:acetyl esterase/lipase
VGEVETFRDECIDYVRRLSTAGTPVEFHIYSGAYHGFDLIAPDSPGLWAAPLSILRPPSSCRPTHSQEPRF